MLWSKATKYSPHFLVGTCAAAQIDDPEQINELIDSNVEFRGVDQKPHIRYVTKLGTSGALVICNNTGFFLSVCACVRASAGEHPSTNHVMS